MEPLYEVRTDIDKKLTDSLFAPAMRISFAVVTAVLALVFLPGIISCVIHGMSYPLSSAAVVLISVIILSTTVLKAYSNQSRSYIAKFGSFQRISFFKREIRVESEHDSASIKYGEISKIKDSGAYLFIYPKTYRALPLKKDGCEKKLLEEIYRLKSSVREGKASEFELC